MVVVLTRHFLCTFFFRADTVQIDEPKGKLQSILAVRGDEILEKEWGCVTCPTRQGGESASSAVACFDALQHVALPRPQGLQGSLNGGDDDKTASTA